MYTGEYVGVQFGTSELRPDLVNLTDDLAKSQDGAVVDGGGGRGQGGRPKTAGTNPVSTWYQPGTNLVPNWRAPS